MHLLSSRYQQSTIVNFISAILWNMNKLDRTLYPTHYINEISEMYRQHGKNIKEDIERSKIGKEFQLTEHEQKSFMIWEDILHIYSKVSSQINSAIFEDSGVVIVCNLSNMPIGSFSPLLTADEESSSLLAFLLLLVVWLKINSFSWALMNN
jgi:hypothetical protein